MIRSDMFWAALFLMNEILPGKLQKMGFLNISLIITTELLETNNSISSFTIFYFISKIYYSCVIYSASTECMQFLNVFTWYSLVATTIPA